MLACLCLLASLGYLTRATDATGPLLLSPFQGQVQTVERGRASDVTAHHFPPVTLDRPVPSGSTAAHGMAVSSAPDLSAAAPNAPPHPHDHAHVAHCPFCFTSAFALEADGVVVVWAGFRLPERAAPLHARVYLAALRHGDPRAPPAAQG